MTLTVSGHCVMQSTKYSLKIKQIHGEWNKWKIRGPSKSAPPSAGLQQTIKLKLKKKQFICSFAIVMIFNIYLQVNNMVILLLVTHSNIKSE